MFAMVPLHLLFLTLLIASHVLCNVPHFVYFWLIIQLLLGQPKVKIFLPCLKLMKHTQTKFHAHTMSKSQVIRSKKSQNLSLGQNFIAAQFFSLY